jgi:hypothetical protein
MPVAHGCFFTFRRCKKHHDQSGTHDEDYDKYSIVKGTMNAPVPIPHVFYFFLAAQDRHGLSTVVAKELPPSAQRESMDDDDSTDNFPGSSRSSLPRKRKSESEFQQLKKAHHEETMKFRHVALGLFVDQRSDIQKQTRLAEFATYSSEIRGLENDIINACSRRNVDDDLVDELLEPTDEALEKVKAPFIQAKALKLRELKKRLSRLEQGLTVATEHATPKLSEKPAQSLLSILNDDESASSLP